MAAKKVGALIKEARTKAELSQEALAKMIEGLSASELGKAERGEKDLSDAVLKAIAKATGVTQKSLLEAPKNVSAKKTSEKKTTEKKTSEKKTTEKKASEKKTASSSTAKKTSSSTAKKTSSGAKKTEDSDKLSAAEKKFLQLYRAADSDSRKTAEKILKGEKDGLMELLLGGAGGTLTDLLGSFLKK